MNLFEDSATGTPSSKRCGKKLKLSRYLIIMLAAILGRVGAVGETDKSVLQSQRRYVDFIKSSCQVTLYREVCVASLSSYATVVRGSKGRLVKAAMKISLTKTKNATDFISKVAAKDAGNKKVSGPLSDCLENLADAVDEIDESLTELKNLKPNTFNFQISNIQTWMSAALTDQDTCLDGFDKSEGKLTQVIAGRVQSISKVTSNALALINSYAVTYQRELERPGETK